MPQAPASSFAIAALDASKAEDPRGVTPYTFTVTRTGDTSTAAVLAYAVSGSGANPATAADFVGNALPGGTVSFAPGDASQAIAVPVQGSPAARPNEGFTVTISAPPAGSAVTGATADGLIRTDDADTTAAKFAATYSPKAAGASNPGVAVQGLLAQRAGGVNGTVAVSSSATGPFRAPAAGVANGAIAVAPAAGSTLALPAGYAALVAKGANAVTLSDAGAAGVLVGNDAGNTFNSTGNGSVLAGGAGNNVFSASGAAAISTGTGQNQVFAFGSGAVTVNSTGTLTALLGGGASTVSHYGAAAAVFCGTGDATVYQGSSYGSQTVVVGSDGRLTMTKDTGDTTVFGGKGAVSFQTTGFGSGTNVVVGGSGALTAGDSSPFGGYSPFGPLVPTSAGTAYVNSFWGYSGKDVLSAAGKSNTLAGVAGDKLSITGGNSNVFLSLTGGVLMDGSKSSGSTVFYGGSAGTDTILTGGSASASGDAAIVVTGANASTVQFGAGKATVFANGSSTITSGTGSADLVFNDRTQFLLNAVAPGSTRVFALFNFVPGTEHISLRNYNPNAAAYALLTQVNAPGFTQLTMPDQTRILLLGVAHADASVFA